MLSLLRVITAVGIVLLVRAIGCMLYNVFFHPLRKYPGPKLWAATGLPWNFHNMRGRLLWQIHALHELYGPVVRIAPNHLSYATGAAWKEIYGHGNPEMTKDKSGFGLPPPANNIVGIPLADTALHRHLRRLLSPAFSERALREQEPVILSYVDLLMTRLHEHARYGPQDLCKWFNRATFDVIGYLVFGESFGGLKESKDHEFISMIFDTVRYLPWVQFATQYHLLGVFGWFAPNQVVRAREDQIKYATDHVNNLFKQGKGSNKQGVFLSYMFQQDEKAEYSLEQSATDAESILVAGSETTATLLSGLCYLLARHPDVNRKLIEEIRSSFSHEKDIDVAAVTTLPYINAVLQETLRIYPPAPGSIPRVVPTPGANIEGQWIPAGTTVGIHQWSANHSSLNFYRANEFLPERWLRHDLPETEKFQNDNKAAAQPFSYGPRNCIGQNLAWVEMRMILARLLWNFDLELCDTSRDWLNSHRSNIIWTKPPLMMLLKPVHQSSSQPSA